MQLLLTMTRGNFDMNGRWAFFKHHVYKFNMRLFHNSNQTLEPDMSVSISNFKPDVKTCAFECTDAEGKPKKPCEDGLLIDLTGDDGQKIAVVKYKIGNAEYQRCYDEETLRKAAQTNGRIRIDGNSNKRIPIPDDEFVIPGIGVQIPMPLEWSRKRKTGWSWGPPPTRPRNETGPVPPVDPYNPTEAAINSYFSDPDTQFDM
jgi:hypothetical protein